MDIQVWMVCRHCDVNWQGKGRVCWLCGEPGEVRHPLALAGAATFRAAEAPLD